MLPSIKLLFIVISISLSSWNWQLVSGDGDCESYIVQSLPDGVDLKDPPGSKIVPTHESLIEMVNGAQKTLRVASFYWWLTAPEQFVDHPSAVPGLKLMEAFVDATKRGVDLEIVLDKSSRKDMNNPDDIAALQNIAKVKFLNMTRLVGGGVVHSKYMIADNQTFYVGSSNFDWRSYTQIKEIGITFERCPKLAQDLDKIFRTYVLMADSTSVPAELGDDLKTLINLQNPLVLGDKKVFLAGSPPPFNGANGSTGRTDDIEALLNVIEKARYHIDISVMNYSPREEFTWPRKYWPRIDDALRRAATERRVKVRMLMSNWTNSKPLERAWYHSLNALQSHELRGGGIHVKLFRVPAFDQFQESIPFARVKHDKYMVTETSLYIGTSNWAPDYFINTCGVGVVIEPTDEVRRNRGPNPAVIKTMKGVFDRDFNSEYAHELN